MSRTTCPIFEVIRNLTAFGVIVIPSGNYVRVIRPDDWPTWYDAPEGAIPLLRDLKARKAEAAAYYNSCPGRWLIYDEREGHARWMC